MKLEYTYSFAEYNAINSARQRRGRFAWLRNWLFWGLVIANVAISLNSIYSFYQNQVSFSWLLFMNLAIAIAIVAYRYFFLPYWNRRFYKLQMLEGKKIQLQVTENGVETVTDDATGQFDWKGLIGADEETEHFVIWVNKILAICIPKRAFKDNDQIDEFRKKIAKNIDNQQFQA